MQRTSMVITVDGPVASGKSTVCLLVAQKLSLYYLYSGLLYRALAYQIVREQGDCYLEENLSRAHIKKLLQDCQYIFSPEKGASVIIGKVDSTPYLKSLEIDQCVSRIAIQENVREALVCFQRKLAYEHDCIADGRDCGTVVFPEADYKFFLTARPEVRAARWQAIQNKQGKILTFADALRFITQRDEQDTQRTLAPCVIPPGAHVIDTSELTLEQTVQELLSVVA